LSARSLAWALVLAFSGPATSRSHPPSPRCTSPLKR
jgi:hypothetical protein